VVVVDTSGSIGEKELSEFGGEIQAILTDLKPRKVHVIYCDAAINKVVEFGPHDPVVLEAVGGGGTSFKPPFKYVEDHQINPRCLVYLTDGYGDFPDEDKVNFPTLWAINNHDVVPPFGEHVVIQV
jgi:predicted metal-dependent peptidase